MKKLITLLILFTISISAQDYTAGIYSTKNSSVTELDSAGVFTGTVEMLRGYNSISITVRANQNGTYKVLFGNTTTITTATAVKTYSFSYTANDTLHTKYIPADAPYYKVVYTNTTTAQTSFYLITMLNKGHVLPINSTAEVLTDDVDANASLNNIEADADSIVDETTASAVSLAIIDDWDESDRAKVNPIVGQAGVAANRGTASATTQRVTIANDDTLSTLGTAIKTSVELLDNSVDGNYLNTNMNVAGTDVSANRGVANAQSIRVTIANDDTTSTLQTAIKTSVQLLDNAVDGNYLNVNTNFAGVDATVNIGNADATTQRVVLASDQPTIPVTLSPTDTVTVKSIVNALPAGTNNIGDVDILSIAAGDNNIGNVDIVTLPSGNLGQQLSAASLSVTPATNIADATYIGDIKFGESLPSGTAIVGQVGIDQTTDGTTNKVQARNATHDNFNANANIQVGDADVANGNPVPVSDAGGTLTVDGSVTANAGTNLNTSALSLESSQLVLLGYQHPADKFPSDTVPKDTVTTETDSLTISTYFSSAPTVWSSMTVRNISTDGTVLQISLSLTFAGSRLVYPNGVDGFSFFSPVSFTKLYIKKYSGTNGFYETSGEAY